VFEKNIFQRRKKELPEKAIKSRQIKMSVYKKRINGIT
jgi:hypothetical protein